ncbi:MAG: diaminopimelate epimerase [Thermodesulfobacteriota bacterium]
MDKIPFSKMSGSGNDFIIIDNREGIVDEDLLKELIVKVCARGMSVGADGLILIERSEWANFKWRFFNADGSSAEMCGNGARCAARFAFLNGIAGRRLTFETESGIILAELTGRRAKVQMPDPTDMIIGQEIDLEGSPVTLSRLRVGVPHVVMKSGEMDDRTLIETGRKIRFHSDFAPEGANVNFVRRKPDGAILNRTYERGVEGETLACGTGSASAALVMAETEGEASPIRVYTKIGTRLTIHFEKTEAGEYYNLFLEGDARLIYTGELRKEAWKW